MLRAASDLNDTEVDVLVHGDSQGVQKQVLEVQKYNGIRKIITV